MVLNRDDFVTDHPFYYTRDKEDIDYYNVNDLIQKLVKKNAASREGYRVFMCTIFNRFNAFFI
jgi:hypothetical protein